MFKWLSFTRKQNKLIRNSFFIALVAMVVLLCALKILAREATPWDCKQGAYNDFLKEFRCVTCPNQNIMDSSAPVAQAMKEEIARRCEQGQSQEGIRTFLLSQYGDYVLYRPTLKNDTCLLWFGPFILLLLGFFVWVRAFCSLRGKP